MPAPETPPAAGGERLHALDAVRGFCLTLGVFFHATMSYLPGPQVWPVKDTSESLVLGAAFFVLHVFRMSLFFMIAGFFGRMMLERRGVGGFVKDRLKRIGLPLVAFWPISIGSIIAISIWAFMAAHPGAGLPPEPKHPAQFGAFPLTHLWFLYVLLWLYAITLGGRAVARGLGPASDRIVGALVKSGAAPVVLAVPFLTAMWFAPGWLMYFGVPSADSNLIVNPQALALFGTAFGFGWLLQRRTDLLQVFARRWLAHLVVAVACTVVCLAIVGPRPVVTPAGHEARTYIFAVAYGLAVWTWSFGILGAALTFLSGHSPARRYLADASYWIYLVHLPLVMSLQVLASMVHAPWWIEYPLILAIAFPIMLGSYQLLVRYTWLGAILNGRRQPRPAKTAVLAAAQGA